MSDGPNRADAQAALRALLAELPAEFCEAPGTRHAISHRTELRVIKRSNVRAVHEALWVLTQDLEGDA